MTDIIDSSGYCSVHESYCCECYRPNVKAIKCQKDCIMTWISVKDRLPKIPKGQYGVSVLVAEFDSTFEEINPGHGYKVHECSYGKTSDRNGKKFMMYEGTAIEYDFLSWYSGYDKNGKHVEQLGPTGDIVTHWMLKPEPPKY